MPLNRTGSRRTPDCLCPGQRQTAGSSSQHLYQAGERPALTLTSHRAHEDELVAAFAPGGLDVPGLLLVVGWLGHDPTEDADSAGQFQSYQVTS